MRGCGIRFPQHLVETTSAFATLAPLQANPSLVGLVWIELAQPFAHRQMSCCATGAAHQRDERQGVAAALQKKHRDLGCLVL